MAMTLLAQHHNEIQIECQSHSRYQCKFR